MKGNVEEIGNITGLMAFMYCAMLSKERLWADEL